MPIFNANNLAGTELSQSVSTSDTSISVVDASVFPATPFLATIDDNSNIEIVKVTSVSSNTLTVERGKEDTTAQSFNSGVEIEQRFTAGMYENLTNTEESQDAAWSIASGGSNISVGYDDANDSVSIDFTGTLYSDEDAQDAVGGILNADFNYDDAGNSISLASNSLTVANTNISLGGSGTPNVTDLDGSGGSSGQFLQTDGSNLSFSDVSSFSGDFNDLENVPTFPPPPDGDTIVDSGGVLEVNRPLRGNTLIKLVSMEGFSADGKNDGDFYVSGEPQGTAIYCNTPYEGSTSDEQNCVNTFDSLGGDADKVKINYSYSAAPGGRNGDTPGKVKLKINGNVEIDVVNTDNQDTSSNSGSIIYNEYDEGFTLNKIYMYTKSGAYENELYGDLPRNSSIEIESVELVYSKSVEVVG